MMRASLLMQRLTYPLVPCEVSMKYIFIVSILMGILCFMISSQYICDYGWASCADGTQVRWPCVPLYYGGIPAGCRALGYTSSEEAAALLCARHGGMKHIRGIFSFQRCGHIG